MRKETKVIFVGDKPSRLNRDRDIAFIGAACHKRLMSWINIIGVTRQHLTNSNKSRDIRTIKFYQGLGYKVVALGLLASKRLDAAKIKYYRLPHPSGLNRMNNDKEYINAKLKECKEYVYESQTSR